MTYQIDELQLHEDEGQQVNRKRHRNNDSATKLEAVSWARKFSIHSAAKKFAVTRSRIKDWMKKENKLQQQQNAAGGSKRMRLDGGGRHVLNPELDVQLAEWVREKRENKQPMSRRVIRNKAAEVFHGTDLKISTGWLDSFLNRNNFSLRRVTTTAQKPPENYAEAVAKFVVYVEERRKVNKFSSIMAMDETAIWFDCPDNRCIETKGAKDVTVVTTGHEKMRVTVCLTACSDGKKLMPYVLVNRKRPVPRIVKQFEGKLLINWNGSVWMDNDTTADYLREIVKPGGVFSGKRLLVWDAFAAHKSEKTLALLKELGIEAAFIPGGCTKFIQAPDVSWNKPLKERIRQYYTIWMSNDADKEFTSGGNPRAPALDIVLGWVNRAWQGITKELISKSFKACALTTALDGTEDQQITCLKPEGSIGTRGLNILRDIRAQRNARDGRCDFEVDGLEECELSEEGMMRRTNQEINLDNFNEEELFLCVE